MKNLQGQELPKSEQRQHRVQKYRFDWQGLDTFKNAIVHVQFLAMYCCYCHKQLKLSDCTYTLAKVSIRTISTN